MYLKGVLSSLGYHASLYDASLYLLRDPTAHGLIWIHVDDSVITGSSKAVLRRLEKDLGGCLEIKWEHALTSVVESNVSRDKAGFSLHQEKLLRKIAGDFSDGVSRASTPLPTAFEPIADPDGNPASSREFLQIVMTLSYLAVGTRPDMAYAPLEGFAAPRQLRSRFPRETPLPFSLRY